MDLASLVGLIGGIALMIYGISTGDAGFASLIAFYDFASILITFGGAFFVTLVTCASFPDFIGKLKSVTIIFKTLPSNEAETIKTIIELSNVARKDGLLALEEAAGNIEDAFMKKGILLIVDGTDPELVRSILETELMCIEDRHKDKTGFWETLGGMGPAWGMIGTLIGLINMLGGLDDPSTVGPAMSTALITTFYGSVLSNWLCTPVFTKLKANSATEIKMKEILVEGLLSIQAGENPRVIEEKLKSFLAPSQRGALSEDEGGEANG